MKLLFVDVRSGTLAEQTARIMVAFERVCLAELPDLVAVVGDVNATLACSVTTQKLLLPVAHVEAGLRNGDVRMPEELRRGSQLRVAYAFSGEITSSSEGRHRTGAKVTDVERRHR